MKRAARPALAALAVFVAGCATAVHGIPEPPAESALPPVAAAYRTEIRHGREVNASEWRLWREAESVQREWLQERAGEVWQLDHGTLFHTVLFHDERRGIEFEPADLQMTGTTSSWAQQAEVVSPAVLQALRGGRSGWQRDVPWREYTGDLNGTHWRVRMRTDLMIPLLVEQTDGQQRSRTVLLEVHPLAEAPWQPTAASGYDMLDFADLGDHERDPFVLRAQARMGLAHGHSH